MSPPFPSFLQNCYAELWMHPTPFPLHIPDIVMFLDINFMKHHIFFFGINVSFHLHGNMARQYRKQETLLWNQTDKPIKTPALASIYNTNLSLFENHASKIKLLFCDGNIEPNVFTTKPALIKSSKILFHIVNKQIRDVIEKGISSNYSLDGQLSIVPNSVVEFNFLIFARFCLYSHKKIGNNKYYNREMSHYLGPP